MLMTFGFVFSALVVLFLHVKAPRRQRDFNLGWVSERWLTEHRGGQSSPVL